MQEKALTDRLKRDEERAEHQIRMQKLEDISAGLVNLLGSIDEDFPSGTLRERQFCESSTRSKLKPTQSSIDSIDSNVTTKQREFPTCQCRF